MTDSTTLNTKKQTTKWPRYWIFSLKYATTRKIAGGLNQSPGPLKRLQVTWYLYSPCCLSGDACHFTLTENWIKWNISITLNTLGEMPVSVSLRGGGLQWILSKAFHFRDEWRAKYRTIEIHKEEVWHSRKSGSTANVQSSGSFSYQSQTYVCDSSIEFQLNMKGIFFYFKPQIIFVRELISHYDLIFK